VRVFGSLLLGALALAAGLWRVDNFWSCAALGFIMGGLALWDVRHGTVSGLSIFEVFWGGGLSVA